MAHNDDRVALWCNGIRVIDEARPDWVIGENVAGLLSMAQFDSEPPVDSQGAAVGKKTETFILEEDTEWQTKLWVRSKRSGYDVALFVVPACAVDAPHRRSRIWIVAHAQQCVSGRETRKHKIDGQKENRSASGVSGSSENVANNNNNTGLEGRKRGELQECSGELPVGAGGSPVAHANGESPGWSSIPRGKHCEWLIEPGVGRVANGIPARVDRLKGLGNAIVPQVAYEIISLIRGIEDFG